jgi:hypothetical protein
MSCADVLVVLHANGFEGLAVLIRQARAGNDAEELAVWFLFHVFGNGCGFTGAGARLDYDGFLLLEGLVIQDL